MSTKTFCDRCGGMIEKPRYTVLIFDRVPDDELLSFDLCTACMRKAKKAIEAV